MLVLFAGEDMSKSVLVAHQTNVVLDSSMTLSHKLAKVSQVSHYFIKPI